MKHWLRICILLLAALLLLAVPVMGYEIPADFSGTTLDEVMDTFLAENGLNENNFSVSYTNTETGETYTFNDEKFMVAGSTYKLPLNMYYYEMEQEGLVAPDAYISRVGATLRDAHYQSLVHSNNEVSIGMLYNLGEFRDYKALMRKYFSMTDEEIDYVYHVDNYYCTRMMMDALCYLYEYRADFDEMAHKYGWFEGAVNDVGIIYAPQPFLLAVYTQDVPEHIVADTAALFTAYNVWQNPPEEEDELTGTVEMEVQYVPKEELTPVQPAEPEQPEIQPEVPAEKPVTVQKAPEKAFEWWMIAVALGVFLVGGGAAALIINPKRIQEKYEKKYEDRIEQ